MEPLLPSRTLVVGIDFSDCCERALLEAVTLAERTGAQLELVHVFEWESQPEHRSVSALAPACDGPPGFSTIVKQQAQATLQRLTQLCSAIVGDRACADVQVLIGDPTEQLLAEAERKHADLIVLGLLGRRLLLGEPIGSTAEGVRANAPVEVMLVS